ncbi:MAG: hypothetical protein GF320_03655, partial [Armatimonadia bacterium]|nr:hypothetical protein [Armatimonadia bacterium]
MLYDSTIMACCLDEIAEAAVGATIREFRQPRKLAVVLELDLPGPSRYLTLSAEAERARMHLADVSPKPSGDSYPLEAFGRKHLRGSRIAGVHQQGFDRVARIDLEVRNPRLIDPVTTLVVELMGKHSNILLLNNVDTVLEALKHITPELSRARTVLPHQEYEPPPTAVGTDPKGATPSEVIDALSQREEMPVGRALGRSFDGISRILAEEVAFRAGMDVDRTVDSLQARERERLADTFTALMADMAAGRWHPVEFEGRRGPSHYGFPLRHLESEAEMRPVDSLCHAVAHHAEADRERGETSSRRAEVTGAIRSALEKLGKRIGDLDRQSDPAPADEARHRAEALAASMHTLRPGMDSATVPD